MASLPSASTPILAMAKLTKWLCLLWPYLDTYYGYAYYGYAYYVYAYYGYTYYGTY